MDIGKNLRSLRNKKGLSLRKLQDEVGISHNTLGAYERGSIQPTIENCYILCKYFEVPIEYLILGDDCIREYNDIELKALFSKVDDMDKENREIIKNYINKYIRTAEEFNALKKEAE